VSEFLLAALGATSCLYAIWDVASDVLLRHSGQSDAAALARLHGRPAVLWGVAWIALSIVVLAGSSGSWPEAARGMTSLSGMHESHRCLTIARPAAVQSPVGSDATDGSRSGTSGRRARMKRIGILTAGGDTPALNATVHARWCAPTSGASRSTASSRATRPC